ncbi:MAG: M23 family metallopeptidase, partial [Rhodothermales bacterium]|nr:M23 family metallopeptidase [Rhodothermales bacterium]
QAFAFDFAGADGATIQAGRGGEVIFAREDQTGNSYSDPNCSNCMANAVTVRHQDGSLSQYFHFQTNGVFVTQGQTIHRGDAVGRVGNTGYSTGPHLHFHARFAAADTHPIRFRSIESVHTTPPFACYIPQQGDLAISDNN